MWWKEELDDCRALYDKIEKVEIHDIVEDDELEIIGRLENVNY